jgi:predicted dehydrogenase
MMKKLQIGVIGAGSIAQMGHLPFYQNHPDVELKALVDINLKRAKGVAAQFNVSNVYSTVEDMFQNEKLDGVSICTINSTHVPIAKLAIQNGVNVLIEKPLGMNYQEVLELQQEVAKSGLTSMIGMTHRFRNDAQALKRFVEAGDLGEIYYAKAKILQRRNTPTGWFTDKSKSGGGPLMDIGVHVLDLAWWLSGQPTIDTVSGHLVQGIGTYETLMQNRWESAEKILPTDLVFNVEDFASGYLRFDNGMVLVLEASWALNGMKDEGIKIELFGTKGGVSLHPLCYYSEKNQILTETKLDIVPNNPQEAEIHHFIESIKRKEESMVPISQGVKVIEMLEAIAISSELKKEIKVSK